MDSAAPDDDCCVVPLCATARSGRLRERIGRILHLRSRSRGGQSCSPLGLQGIASEAQVALPRRSPRTSGPWPSARIYLPSTGKLVCTASADRSSYSLV